MLQRNVDDLTTDVYRRREAAMKHFRRVCQELFMLLAMLGVTGVLAISGPAQAGERACVTCLDPDAQYSCSLAPTEAGETGLGLSGAALKVRCIREIAETYGHQSCKVGDTPITACAGTVHMISPQPTGSDTSPGPRPANTATPPANPSPADGNDAPPKTVVEMAKRTAGETQEQLEKSGKVVERAARQTWRCVTSLFTACDAKSEDNTDPAPSPDQ